MNNTAMNIKSLCLCELTVGVHASDLFPGSDLILPQRPQLGSSTNHMVNDGTIQAMCLVEVSLCSPIAVACYPVIVDIVYSIFVFFIVA